MEGATRLGSASDRRADALAELAAERALRSRESGGWGLLLIPVLVCVGMLIFAVATSTLPHRTERLEEQRCAVVNAPRFPTHPC